MSGSQIPQTAPRALDIPTCPECGSREVTLDAQVNWNINGQYWELQSPFECLEHGGYCHDCDVDEITLKWIIE